MHETRKTERACAIVERWYTEVAAGIQAEGCAQISRTGAIAAHAVLVFIVQIARDLFSTQRCSVLIQLRRLAPTRFTGKLALQRLAAVVLRIRSTTGNTTPSLVYTRRADEFTTNGISSSRCSERVQPRQATHGGGRRKGRRPRGVVEREGAASV
ncbi:hypothetical protein F511_25032 [Dorcoceras hygrometricum]|uniref:Uncharacterized protein n=1 Tax=Dorcoceras hygrometricum TaxID=472368 RepID=A0A2Z7AN83_9LAMI|nr:hypothetical protein F511_25032 [Dorcoceras hygrometricum]